MSITVEIESEFLPKRKDAHDIYRPVLYTYNPDSKSFTTPHARHLDVVKTWKNLDYRHAEELLFWETATRAALESCLEEKLISLLVASEKDLDDLPAIDTLYRTRDFVNKLGRRRLEFPLSTLTRFMAEYHGAYGRHFKWLMNISDVDIVLGNYLRTFDFFRQDDLGICIVDLDLVAFILDDGKAWSDDTQSSHSLRVIGTCKCQPHKLHFAIQSLTIVHPWFKEPVLDLDVPVFNTVVAIDDDAAYSKRTGVTVNKYFPDNVRLERTIRLDLSEHIDRSRLDPAAISDKKSVSDIMANNDSRHQLRERKVPGTQNKKRPLRAISNGSARVQGFATSAFEQAAKNKHRKLYEAYTEGRRENLRNPLSFVDRKDPRMHRNDTLPRHRQSIDDISRPVSSLYDPSSVDVSMYKGDVSSSSSVSPPLARTAAAGFISAVPRGTPRSRYNAHREEHSRALANPSPVATRVCISSTQHHISPRFHEKPQPERFYPTWSQVVQSKASGNSKPSLMAIDYAYDSTCNRHDFLAQLEEFPKLGNAGQSGLKSPPDLPFHGREHVGLDQEAIKRNYEEFTRKTPQNARVPNRLEEEESRSIEEAFLQAGGSDTDGDSGFERSFLFTTTAPENAQPNERPGSSSTVKTFPRHMREARPAFDGSSDRKLKHTTSFRDLRPLDYKMTALQETSDIRLNTLSRSKQCLSSPTLRKSRPLARDDAALREQEDDLFEVEDRERATNDLQLFDLRRSTEYGDYEDALEPEWYE